MTSKPDVIELLYGELVASDIMVAKALGVSAMASLALSQARMADYLNAQWKALAEVAVDNSVRIITSGKGELTESDVDRAVREVGDVMDGWSSRVSEEMRRYVRESYLYGREVGFNQANGFDKNLRFVFDVQKAELELVIKPSFTLEDKQAIGALSDHQVFWIGNHYKENVSETIGMVSKAQLLVGQGRITAGKRMESVVSVCLRDIKIPDGFNGTHQQYFTMLVGNATTVARSSGHLASFHKAGFSTYKIVNPIDTRTCKVCSVLDGKEFRVADGMALNQSLINAKSPGDVRKIKPWLNPKTAIGLAGKSGSMGYKMTGALAKAGQSFPPFHGFCRCSLDVTGMPTYPEETNIGGGTPEMKLPDASPNLTEKVKQVLKKPKSKPKKIKPPDPPTPPPAPNKSPDISSVDASAAVKPNGFKWEPWQLRRTERAFGGAHTGKIGFVDPDNVEWMFKKGNGLQVYGEHAASKIGTALGVPQAEMHVIEIDGKLGVVQKLYKNVKGDLKAGGGVPIESLTEKQIGQVQREHAFDWLVGNHDSHGGNLLVVGDDIVGIDKGQAFKFFGKDRLSIDYNPNEAYGEISYVNRQMKRYIAGEGKPTFKIGIKKELEEFLDNVEKMGDEEYLNLVKPYVTRGSGSPFGPYATYDSEAQVNFALIRRKNGLRVAIDQFWKNIESQRAKAVRGLVPLKVSSKGAVTPITKEFIEEADAAMWRGKALHIAGDDWESMQALVYGTDSNSFIEGKLRREANKRIEALARKLTGSDDTLDKMFDQILKYGGEIDSAFAPGGNWYLSDETEELGKTLFGLFHGTSPEQIPEHIRPAWIHYKDRISDWWGKNGELVKEKVIGAKITKYIKPQQGVKVEGIKSFKIKGYFEEGEKNYRGGKIVMGDGGGHSFIGETYHIEFDDGMKIEYVRHDDGNRYSKQGKIRIHLGDKLGKISTDDINRAMKNLEKLGISNKLANKDDLELLYLIKSANAAGKLDYAEYFPVASKTVKQNIAHIKKVWELDLGKKLTKSMGYRPLPESDFLDGSGYAKWRRFDLNRDELYKNDVALYHTFYRGTEDLEAMLEGGSNAIIATEDRYRIGLVAKGKSPGKDQETGGASYVFTRLRTSQHETVWREHRFHLKFHPDAMDVDSFSYNFDNYGNAHPENLARAKKVGTEKIINVAAEGGSDNETMIKNSISLEKWLDEVEVDESERDKFIELFKRNGITKVGPNRKPIEKAIVTHFTRKTR